MPNGTYGGVRGTETKVGQKTFVSRPTRLLICISQSISFLANSIYFLQYNLHPHSILPHTPSPTLKTPFKSQSKSPLHNLTLHHNEAGRRPDCRRRKKQAGGLQTRLAPGDNPGIIRKIDIFNAGGFVLPRPSTALNHQRS